jgi:type 1 glutamine amidotransferase
VDSPLVDILLSPAAKAVLEEEVPGATNRLPPQLAGTEAPTFAAIISVRTLFGMIGAPADKLEPIDQRLASLPVTDPDRSARCARYDNAEPELELEEGKVSVLVFHKINGFDHGPSVAAATHAIQALGEQLGWNVAVTDKGGAFTPDTLARFDAVIWNNVSGDVLTLSQRQAFEDYINGGGGFLGIHGSGGDSVHFWPWYVDTLLGARFIGHPSDPQFQDARLHIEENPGGIGESLAPGWTMKDEWYSFASNPRDSGAAVVATLDESTYVPDGYGGQDLRMGDDHPIVWTRCVGGGRSLYTAIGHRPEVYHLPENLILLRNALVWTAGQGVDSCDQ